MRLIEGVISINMNRLKRYDKLINTSFWGILLISSMMLLCIFISIWAIVNNSWPTFNDLTIKASVLVLIVISVVCSAQFYYKLPKAMIYLRKDEEKKESIIINSISSYSILITPKLEKGLLSDTHDVYEMVLKVPCSGPYIFIVDYTVIIGESNEIKKKSKRVELDLSSGYITQKIITLS